MDIYTVAIISSYAHTYSEDRISGQSFKDFDSALEYAIDWLVYDNFITDDEIPEVERMFRETGAYYEGKNKIEIYIVKNELK